MSGSGAVEAGDYDYWRSRFGNSLSGSGGGEVAVSEPATAALALLGLTLIGHRHRVLNLR